MKCNATIAAVASVAAVMSGVQAAHARTYSVVTCGDARASVNNAWTSYNNDSGSGQLETGSDCGGHPSFGGLFVRDALNCVSGCGSIPTGARAAWVFAAPTGTTITGLSYSRWLYKDADDDWNPSLEADGTSVETCAIEYPATDCAVGAEGGERATWAINNASTLEIGVRCRPNRYNNCVGGATLHQVVAVLYGATVTLSDPSAPVVSDVGGSLFGGGYLAGTRSASFSASDNAGIESARIYVDGQPQPSAAYSCDFTYAVPCSNRVGESLTLNTGTLADGTHTVEVAASDPASNEGRSASRTITVDNTAPGAPERLAVDGGGTQSRNNFTVRWTNPDGQVAPIVLAHWQLCPAVGGACSGGENAGQDLSHIDDIRAPAPGDYRLSVWLEDAAGNTASADVATTMVRYYQTSTTTGGNSTGGATPGASTPDIDFSGPVDGGSDAATGGGQQAANARRSPALRLTSARFANGHMTVRGRTAAGVRGRLLVSVRVGRRLLVLHRGVRGGGFRLVIRVPSPPRRVSVRYPGSERFLPAAGSARVR